MKKIIISTAIFIFFGGCTLTLLVARGTVNNKITILEQKNLYFDNRGDIPFEGLSDLTYDTKN
ncbi:MAG TPA: hypothetical protein ENK99_07620, partial [Campylobacterales bacterium]|nr:hypothetical protein [Campylobacterales bacterium]